MEKVNETLGVINFILSRLSFLFIMFFSILIFSQRQTEKEELYQNAYGNLYSNPEKTITISEYLINNSNSTEEKLKALNLKAETLIIQGKYIVALNTLLESLNFNDDENSLEIVSTNLILSDLYRQLGIYSKAQERLNLVKELTYNKENFRKSALFIHHLNSQSALLSEQQKYNKAIDVYKNNGLPDLSAQFPYHICKFYNQLAKIYLLNYQPDSSIYYSKKSLELSHKSGLDENFMAYAELELSKANFLQEEKQNYLNSIPLLLNLSEKVSDNVLKKNIHQFLAGVYNNQGENANYQLHNLKYLDINESVNSSQQKARDLILSLNDSNISSKESKDLNPNYILFAIIGFAAVLLIIVFWYRYQTKQKYNYYTEYIRKLKTREKEEISVIENVVNEPSKVNQIIPEKTEQILLEKLSKFENGTDFTQKNLTLNSLAKDLDTNTRYLSEIVNKHKHKNFNAYINELRINYIIQKLQTEPKFLNYKISYLADECGFSSHTAFSTVFKSVTEISPKEFINFIKKESLAVSV